MDDTLNILEDLIERALKAGADATDVIAVNGRSSSVAVRMGELEDVERSEGRDLGLRVFIGRQQAIVSSSDDRPSAREELVDRAVSMARAAPEDPWCGLLASEFLATNFLAGDSEISPDLFDPTEPTAEDLIALAKEAEDAARAVDGVTNSEGGSAGWSKSNIALMTSGGFSGAYGSSGFSISASVLAGEGTGMERDYDYSSARHFEDLETANVIGTRAGQRAVARLNPRKVETADVPVIFDPRVSGGLIGHLAGAVNGRAIARGTSFLKGDLGAQIFADGVQIVDDPVRARGLRSKPFDGEGAETRALAIIEDGKLMSWVLDGASARQLDMTTTGHARRGTSSPPSPGTTNLYLAAGSESAEALIGSCKSGFLVTELIGMGVNVLNGDYSRGASGFWIEDGQVAYPVSEVTIAGNLRDMYRSLVPASDLEFRYGTDAPTVLIEKMTVAGA